MPEETKENDSSSPSMTAEEREKVLDRLGGGMADSSSLVISVAVGLLGILALYEFSPSLTSAAWILLSIAYWIIFLFGLQIFAFHQVNQVLFNRYARDEPYRTLSKQSRTLAASLWLSKIVYKAYIDENEKPTMEKFTRKEGAFANLTVLFYFFVALMMWVAIAVI